MDIAMCFHETCPARESCKRHPDSGTKPDPVGQTIMLWKPTVKGNTLECDGYWPKEKNDGK